METAAGEAPLMLDVAGVAKLTGLGVRSVERLLARGVLRKLKPAGIRRTMVSREEVVKWVARGCPRK